MEMTTPLDSPVAAPVSLKGVAAAKVVLGSGIGMAVSFAPVLIYTFGTFLLPIVQDTGWPRATVAAAAAPATLIAGLMQLFVGWFVDRFDPRLFATLAFAMFAAGLIGLGLVPHSPVAFVVCFALMGVLASGLSVTGFTYLVASRFTARRGLALGIINAFTAASAMVMPLIATALIVSVGWRHAYVVLGLGVAVLGAIAVIWLIPKGDAKRAADPDALPWARVIGALFRNPHFWLLAVAFLFMTSAVQGTVISLVPMLVDRGYRPADAAGAMGVYGVTMLFARFGLGTLLDYWPPRVIAVIGCLGPLAACLVLSGSSVTLAVFLSAALLGIGAGAESDVLPYVIARMFGRANLGQKIGVFIVVFGLGTSLGVLLFARVRELSGSYESALFAGAALSTFALVIFVAMRARGLSTRGEPA